ncbi:MAG TPA: hypothetical protein VHO24_03630 [Opitutaceae bacterium]|nr:hypothetical protein [Opitutaceae bacterium]
MKTPSQKLIWLLVLWGVAAGFAGRFNLLGHLPSRAVPVLLASLSIGFSIAVVRIAWLREAVRELNVRVILAAHLIRFAGFYFLWLYAQGKLPAEFAHRAGGGDIAAAAGALVLLFWPEGRGFRRVFLGWNILGALDLFVALGTGGWLNIVRPGSMSELGTLPMALVPLWLVPVLLSSHLYFLRMHLLEDRGQRGHALPVRKTRAI